MSIADLRCSLNLSSCNYSAQVLRFNDLQQFLFLLSLCSILQSFELCPFEFCISLGCLSSLSIFLCLRSLALAFLLANLTLSISARVSVKLDSETGRFASLLLLEIAITDDFSRKLFRSQLTITGVCEHGGCAVVIVLL